MSFAFPIFLWGIGLIAIPVWLHLSRRRKFKEIRVGTLRFLEKAQLPRKRVARIEELLLLFLRVAALVILSLLFARPSIPGVLPTDVEAGKTILLLDASGSISESMAETVREKGGDVVRLAGKSTGHDVTVAQFADQVTVLEKLEDYAPISGAPTRFDNALNWAVDRILDSENSGGGKIILVGHLAQSALTHPFERVWPGTIELEVVPVNSGGQENSFVSGVEMRTPYSEEEMEVEVKVMVREGEERKVFIECDGFREEKAVPSGEQWVRFQFRPARSDVVGWAGIVNADDDWSIDDRRPFAFHPVERGRVLLVDGDLGDTPFDGETYFLKKALEASGASHGVSGFGVTLAYGLSNRKGLIELDSFQSIALCDVHAFSDEEVSHLVKFVGDGGGLFIVLGDRWDREAYGRLSKAGLFPVNIDRIGGQDNRRLAEWDRGFSAFSALGADGLREVEWAERIEIKSSEEWTSIAKLETGTAIMAKKGNVIVCAHPMNRDWSDLPRRPVFVPLVKGLFAAISGVERTVPLAREVVIGGSEDREPNWYTIEDNTIEIVVPSVEESMVETEPLDSFVAMLGRGAPDEREGDGLSEQDIDAGAFHADKEIWPWFALLLLGWLILEGICGTAPQRRVAIS